MKTSKKAQEKTKIKLIETAVDIMIQKGYERATMREIARAAGVGDATIYNYFPSKERIVWDYIKLRHLQAVEGLAKLPDFDSFSLQEKIHTYFDVILEGFLPDREFLPIAFKMTQQSFLTHSEDVKAINTIFLNQVRTFLEDAIASEEIPDQPVETFIPHIILDIYFVVVMYWSKDSSEHFSQTTQLIDLILNILIGVLQQGLIAKGLDLGSFLIRQHMFSHINNLLKESPLKTIKSELKRFSS